ncbi:integral membrane protein-like protein [Burkholderia pseudomallei]|nr:integral membrane protein-like protein [Burkholderia pseudomallei]
MEAANGLHDAEPVLADWLMKRNCSVSPRQFVAFYVSLAAFSLLIAVLLLWRGAWLVLPFTGIELLAVGVAFAIYARHAVDYERIRLFPHRLVIERMSAERLTQIELNPRWVRGRAGCVAARSHHAGVARRVRRGRAAPCAIPARAVRARAARLAFALRLNEAAGAKRATCDGGGFEWKFWVRKL